ncbi:MAG: dihydrofolate reductase family protein [Actinomycetota bacterium]
MRRLISYMFTSLDGFIADRDGGLDWVPIDDELMRFANTYFATAGGIVFGRKVHEGFVSYWDELDAANPSVTELEAEFAQIFGNMERIVASNTLRDAPEGTIVIADDLPAAIGDLKDRPGGDLLLICGPDLRSTLAGHGLIDRYRSLVAPVALGEGVPLFSPLREPARLRLLDSSTFEGGVVMLDHTPA